MRGGTQVSRLPMRVSCWSCPSRATLTPLCAAAQGGSIGALRVLTVLIGCAIGSTAAQQPSVQTTSLGLSWRIDDNDGNVMYTNEITDRSPMQDEPHTSGFPGLPVVSNHAVLIDGPKKIDGVNQYTWLLSPVRIL